MVIRTAPRTRTSWTQDITLIATPAKIKGLPEAKLRRQQKVPQRTVTRDAERQVFIPGPGQELQISPTQNCKSPLTTGSGTSRLIDWNPSSPPCNLRRMLIATRENESRHSPGGVADTATKYTRQHTTSVENRKSRSKRGARAGKRHFEG